MKALIGAMIVALTAGVALAQVDYVPLPKPKLAPKVGISKKDFDEIKAGLEQNAAALIDGSSFDTAAPSMISISFTPFLMPLESSFERPRFSALFTATTSLPVRECLILCSLRYEYKRVLPRTQSFAFNEFCL